MAENKLMLLLLYLPVSAGGRPSAAVFSPLDAEDRIPFNFPILVSLRAKVEDIFNLMQFQMKWNLNQSAVSLARKHERERDGGFNKLSEGGGRLVAQLFSSIVFWK